MHAPTSRDVEITVEFGLWFGDLNEADQDAIGLTVSLLMAQGPNVRFPYCSGVNKSRHAQMREATATSMSG